MKRKSYILSLILVFALMNCNSNNGIERLLNSENKEDVILGAYKAGESGDRKYVPLLLKDADDIRTSINIRFKGISVYQAKMVALRKIYGKDPPVRISDIPDSTVINFYRRLANLD